MAKCKTSLEDYKALGRTMSKMGNELTHQYIEVCRLKGVTSPEAIALKSACKAFGKSKSLLDDHVATDYPNVPTANIFYTQVEDADGLTCRELGKVSGCKLNL